jgi:hypothetical protein
MSKELEKMWKLSWHYPGIYVEGLRKFTKILLSAVIQPRLEPGTS